MYLLEEFSVLFPYCDMQASSLLWSNFPMVDWLIWNSYFVVDLMLRALKDSLDREAPG